MCVLEIWYKTLIAKLSIPLLVCLKYSALLILELHKNYNCKRIMNENTTLTPTHGAIHRANFVVVHKQKYLSIFEELRSKMSLLSLYEILDLYTQMN